MAFDSISPVRFSSVHDAVRRPEPRADELPADRTQSIDPRAATDSRSAPAAAGDESANLSKRDDQGEGRNRLTAQKELSQEERQAVAELQQRDREVKNHEHAHKAAAGRFARSAPSYEFESGPDGNKYAVGGEVQIDTSPVADDPRASIQKFETVRRAALAPANPSSQDRQVAAVAQQEIAKARAELAEAPGEDSDGDSDDAGPHRGDPLAPTGQLFDLIA